MSNIWVATIALLIHLLRVVARLPAHVRRRGVVSQLELFLSNVNVSIARPEVTMGIRPSR